MAAMWPFTRRRLACSLILAALLVSALVPASAASKITLSQTEAQISQLRQDLAVERAVREAQTTDANDYFNAVTIIVGVATLLIAAVAIGATVVGFRLVRDYVQKEFDQRIADAFEQKVTPVIASHFDEALATYDEPFAELAAQFRQGTSQ